MITHCHGFIEYEKRDGHLNAKNGIYMVKKRNKVVSKYENKSEYVCMLTD